MPDSQPAATPAPTEVHPAPQGPQNPEKPKDLAAQAAAKTVAQAGGDKVAAPASETPPPEAKPKHTPNPRVREFAALTRKEREVRALLTHQQKEAQELQQWKALRSEAKRNPDAYLKAAQLSYDDVTNHYLEGKGGGSRPQGELEERLTRTEQALQQAIGRLEAKEVNEAVQKYVAKISDFVESHQDEFELVRHYEATQDVYELIDLHYQRTGEMLDIQEAAERIEAVLEETKIEEGKKLLAARKLKQRLGLPAEQTDPSKGSTQRLPSPPATGESITNELTPSAGDIPAKRVLTEDEQWKALVARARAGA